MKEAIEQQVHLPPPPPPKFKVPRTHHHHHDNLCSTHCGPGDLLRALYSSKYLILPATLYARYCCSSMLQMETLRPRGLNYPPQSYSWQSQDSTQALPLNQWLNQCHLLQGQISSQTSLMSPECSPGFQPWREQLQEVPGAMSALKYSVHFKLMASLALLLN